MSSTTTSFKVLTNTIVQRGKAVGRFIRCAPYYQVGVYTWWNYDDSGLAEICTAKGPWILLEGVELTKHRAFIIGDMPREIYADWLQEEFEAIIPQEVLDILRAPDAR